MAIITANNLGRLKKKSGPNVFRKWRNLQVMAVYNSEVKNPNTDAQKLVRSVFVALTKLASAFSSAVVLGFENVCKGTKTPQRCFFVKKNWAAVTGSSSTSATVDFSELVVSQGGLPEIQFGTPDYSNPLQVNVPINDSASVVGTHRDDKAFVFVYSEDADAGILVDTASRIDEDVTINVPAYWVGHKVHVYGFGKGSDDNALNAGEYSDSRYLGYGTIS